STSCNRPRLPDHALVGPGELFVAVVDGAQESAGNKAVRREGIEAVYPFALSPPGGRRTRRAMRDIYMHYLPGSAVPLRRRIAHPHPVADLESAGHGRSPSK